MNVAIIALIGLAAALFIFLKVSRSFKKADCESCCGSYSSNCNKKNNKEISRYIGKI